MRSRYLEPLVTKDLKEKMVFIGGPRQVGKTTMAKSIATDSYEFSQYLNWDEKNDRRSIMEGSFDAKSKLMIFDEIHKYKQWKNMIKGIFDKHKERFSILVTGSARLDIFRKGGDSLLGRYYHYRLHPFSVAELNKTKQKFQTFKELIFEESPSKKSFENLFRFGGFPEPLLKQDETFLRRWHNQRLDRLIKEDIRDATLVRDISTLQILADILPSKVGALLSINSLKEDLQVSHKTVSLWVDVLERFYYHFRIYPFTGNAIKSLRKEPKLYLWDWSELENEAAKFENIIASHLLKFVHYLYDVKGYKAELNYLRDIEGREVDFIVSIDKKPWFTVEVKLSDKEPAKNIQYFTKRLKIPFSYQVIMPPGIDLIKNNTRVISADLFLNGLV